MNGMECTTLVVKNLKFVKETIANPNMVAAGAGQDNRNKKIIFKNWASFTDCTSEISNKKIDHA